jgi:hypothetical protein
MRLARPAPLLALLALIPPAHGGLLDDPEVSFVGSYVTNAFGPASEVDVQATTLRLVVGDTLRLRADVPFLRVRSANEILGIGLGPIPVDPRRQGPGNDGSGQDPGQGPGGPGGPGGDESGGSDGTLPSEPVATLQEEWTSGLGDVWLGLDWTLAGGDAKEYRADLELEAKLPTADEQENLGTGELDLRLGLAAEYVSWSVSAFAGVGWNRLGDPPWVELQDVLDVYAGLESQPLAERIIVFGWLQGNEAVMAGDGSRSLAGLGARGVGKLRWQVQLTSRLRGPAPDFGASVGLSFGLDREERARPG